MGLTWFMISEPLRQIKSYIITLHCLKHNPSFHPKLNYIVTCCRWLSRYIFAKQIWWSGEGRETEGSWLFLLSCSSKQKTSFSESNQKIKLIKEKCITIKMNEPFLKMKCNFINLELNINFKVEKLCSAQPRFKTRIFSYLKEHRNEWGELMDAVAMG